MPMPDLAVPYAAPISKRLVSSMVWCRHRNQAMDGRCLQGEHTSEDHGARDASLQARGQSASGSSIDCYGGKKAGVARTIPMNGAYGGVRSTSAILTVDKYT
jgi:hypothetical protein